MNDEDLPLIYQECDEDEWVRQSLAAMGWPSEPTTEEPEVEAP